MTFGLLRASGHPGKGLSLIVTVALLALVGCEEQRIKMPAHWEKALGEVRTVGVLPFEDAAGVNSKGSGKLVVSAVAGEIVKSPGVRVVERAKLDAIVQEKELKDVFSSSTARKIGKLAGADVVILGEVTQYEAQQEYGHTAVYVVSGGGTKRIHRVGISVRAVRVSDGNIIYSRQGGGSDPNGYSVAIQQAADQVMKPWRQFFDERYRKETAPSADATQK